MALTKCCCCCDLLSGVKALGIVLAILDGLSAVAAVISIFVLGTGNYLGLIAPGVFFTVNVLLIIATKERKRVFLMPW
jgi:hypothetical protein